MRPQVTIYSLGSCTTWGVVQCTHAHATCHMHMHMPHAHAHAHAHLHVHVRRCTQADLGGERVVYGLEPTALCGIGLTQCLEELLR